MDLLSVMAVVLRLGNNCSFNRSVGQSILNMQFLAERQLLRVSRIGSGRNLAITLKVSF
jgi:hypothetical protein